MENRKSHRLNLQMFNVDSPFFLSTMTFPLSIMYKMALCVLSPYLFTT